MSRQASGKEVGCRWLALAEHTAMHIVIVDRVEQKEQSNPIHSRAALAVVPRTEHFSPSDHQSEVS